jgi:hypothetical protein
MCRALLLASALALAGLPAPRASAAPPAPPPPPSPPSIEELARLSAAVVRARVSEVQARWVGTRIFSFARLEGAVAWRGAIAAGATVVTAGGVVGDLGQRVDGAATFEPGEEVVLFLEAAEGGAYRVVGRAQGKLVVRGGAAHPGAGGAAVPVDVLARRVRAVR